jgi:prophage regulatory protein
MAERLLRLKEVVQQTGLSRSTVYLKMKEGRFPTPVHLASDVIVGWPSSDIDRWINQQIAAERVAQIESDDRR